MWNDLKTCEPIYHGYALHAYIITYQEEEKEKKTGVSTFYLLPRDRSWCAHILELIFSIWLILFRFFFLSLFEFYSQLKIWWSHALESKLRVLMLALCAQLGSKLKSTADRRQRTEERERKKTGKTIKSSLLLIILSFEIFWNIVWIRSLGVFEQVSMCGFVRPAE